MKYLNLSENKTQSEKSLALGFESFFFSGGEPHIKLETSRIDDDVTITCRITSMNELGMLMVANDAVRRIQSPGYGVLLNTSYFPGARQDRVAVLGEPLTVKVYADIINSMGFDKVFISDPHSDVAAAFSDRDWEVGCV